MKCRKHEIQCDYLRSQPALGRNSVQLQPRNRISEDADDELVSSTSTRYQQSDKQINGFSDESLHALIIAPSARSTLLNPSLELCPNAWTDMTSPLASLHHFEAFTSYTCGSPMGQTIFRSCIIALAGQSPYLMHAMLGVAAAHMAYLLPPQVNAVQHARNKLADAWHWGHSLALFRKELGGNGTAVGAGRENMDALLSTIMLVAIHQFMLRDDDGRPLSSDPSERWKSSFVFMEDGEQRSVAMKWLTIQSGFKLLLNQLERYLPESVWLPIFNDADPHQRLNPSLRINDIWEGDIDEVERLLCEYCNITHESTEQNNVYYSALEPVIFVRRQRPVTANSFNKLITVMGRITPELKNLIWIRDTGALLILCHFLSLMFEMSPKQWWISARAERECCAIVKYLHAQLAEEGVAKSRIRKVLEEPARAMGVII